MSGQHINKEQFADFLTGDLNQKTKDLIQSHLAECDSCCAELENLSEIWSKLGVLPEEQPSNAVRSRFYSMLKAYKQDLNQAKAKSSVRRIFDNWVRPWWTRHPAFQFSTALSLMVIGLIAGYLINSKRYTGADIVLLREEMKSLRQTVAVSLLDHQSAVERLRGISVSYDLGEPDTKILEKLLSTLNSDPNPNVRLAATDALYLFRNHPLVKQGLAASLSKQDSPLVQLALIDLISEIREQRAIDALRTLIQNKDLNPEVKQRAEQGLEKLL